MSAHRTARQRLLAALKALVLDHPYFGSLAVRLILTEEVRGRTRTAATDGRTLVYHRPFVEGCSDEALVGLWAHEVMHAALLHHTRRGDRNPRAWNEAADFAINPLLDAAGLTLPAGALIDPQYQGMSAEQIYAARIGPEDPADGADEGERSSGNGTCQGQEGGAGGEDTPAAQKAPAEHDLADLPGAVWDAPDPIAQEAQWKIAAVQAALAAKMMGRLPAGIPALVEDMTRSRVDWRSMLRRFVQQCARADYTWCRPNRRYLASGVFLPELRSEAMPPIVVGWDSSGSTSTIIPAFKAELQSIVDECQPESTVVIMADADVQRVDRFERGEPLEFNVEGLGGTDFRPVFDYVQREQLHPACLVYLTDGYGVYPESPPDYPTLWAICSGEAPPWGQYVQIDPEAV